MIFQLLKVTRKLKTIKTVSEARGPVCKGFFKKSLLKTITTVSEARGPVFKGFFKELLIKNN